MADTPSTSEVTSVAAPVAAASASAPAPEKEKKQKQAKNSKRGRNATKGIIEIEPVMGARDFYPEDMRLRNWLFNGFREVARSFCFQEYDCPVLELEELYKRKAGEDITKQMYNFKDKDGYDVALRPEMTPSLARLILKRGKSMILPVRWFTVAQCWRFETIQLGRKREHYQWNMDVIGVSAVTAEVELLGAITTFFSSLGLKSTDVGIKVNSRKVLQQVLEPLGVVGDKFAPVCVVVDKLDKLTEEEVHKELTALELGPEVIAKITEALGIQNLEALEALLGPTNEAVVEIKQVWALAKAYGFDDWLIFDASVVRGLAYYTGVVFEAFDRQKQFRAICGGGRYDKLLSLYGSKEIIPAAGFGMGDVVIVELLKAKGLLPNFPPQVDFMVVPYDENLRPAACSVASKLRSLGLRVEVQLIPKKKIGWCYELADRIGAEKLCFVAPDEWNAGTIRVKKLRVPETDPKKQFDVKFETLTLADLD